jgi:serine protease Do
MKLMKHLLVFTVFLGVAFDSNPLFAAEASAVKQLENGFISVGKEAIPAVVWIKVKSSVKERSLGNHKDSHDFFDSDFLQQFFGFPNDLYEMPIAGQASGFIISPDGYILTNSHVVHEMSEITVVLNDEREFTAKVIGQDINTDLALLKIEATGLPYLRLGDSNNLEVGQWVVAIGNPFGLQASLTVGVVSAKGRNNLSLSPVENYIQTDAAINRGNSGGPLLNLDGEVIGINTAIITDGGLGYAGVGFAIPSNFAKYDIEQIKEKGSVSRGFIGVMLQQMDANLAKGFGLEKAEGAVVTEVTKDSPAEKAGIKQGDVILKYNDQPVVSVGALRNAVSMTAPGKTINFMVLRGKETVQIPVTITIFPNAQNQPIGKTEEESQKENILGIDVQALTPEIANSLGYKEQKGVVISKVKAGSVGAWAGLKKGALILEVNRQPVNDVEQFNSALKSAEKGKPLLLLVKQGDLINYLSVKVN